MAATLPGIGLASLAATQSLPRAQQLAALGTVLCLYRHQDGSELSGWVRAVRVESRAGVDSDGLRESLAFFDHEGRCCWRLYLLPDSDFVAWDRLSARLPSREEAEAATRVGERLWRRLAGRLLGGQWHACVLRLHVVPAEVRRPVLAASPAAVSPLGAAMAQRIARTEGAEQNIRVDDCCCAQSASRPGEQIVAGDEALPLLRFNPRKTS
ncbi:Hemin transport protein [Pseudoxanthomonas yeongjuensis]|uniref:Hemin transport protein n=1 Tax=Pseudoxanthomonas yeongjuensis TaxID=377616 RepID=UPI0013919140|nr:Hemin transport protein [Pseudoxanthomonas yeongjuensis]KAF1718594.1 Hemin transport protein [Pseudoxanthomonas yeongjuensis]